MKSSSSSGSRLGSGGVATVAGWQGGRVAGWQGGRVDAGLHRGQATAELVELLPVGMRPMLGNEELLAVREDYDGAEPAANHLAAENLIKLATLLDLADYAVRAESLLRAGSTVIEKQAFAVPVLLVALDLHLRGLAKCQVPADADPATLGKLGSLYQPRAVFTSDEGSDVIVCEGQSCRLFV